MRTSYGWDVPNSDLTWLSLTIKLPLQMEYPMSSNSASGASTSPSIASTSQPGPVLYQTHFLFKFYHGNSPAWQKNHDRPNKLCNPISLRFLWNPSLWMVIISHYSQIFHWGKFSLFWRIWGRVLPFWSKIQFLPLLIFESKKFQRNVCDFIWEKFLMIS